MHFAKFITVCTFSCLLLCLCYGASPERSTSSSFSSHRHYSEDEEMFIINQLRNYPGRFLPIWGEEMWKKIVKNHDKMRELNPNVIPHRTHIAIGTYFQRKMLTSQGKVKLPDDILERIPPLQQKEEGDNAGPSNSKRNEDENVSRLARQREINRADKYTPEEDEFIINFVKNYYARKSKSASGDKMWSEAAEQFCQFQKSKPSSFPLVERSAGALRERFRRISRRTANPSLENIEQETVNKVTHLAEARIIRRAQYTPEEDGFIINFFEDYPHDTKNASNKMWHEAERQLKELRRLKPSMFPHERSGPALRERHRRISKKFAHKRKKTTNERTDDMVQELLDAPFDVNFASLGQ